MIMTKSIKTFAAAFALAIMATGAQAASVNCDTLSPDVSNLVTPNIGCEALTSANNDSNATVSGMFGVTDWNQIAKVEPLPGSSNGFLTIGGTEEEGTWSIAASVLSSWQNIMLVFKGGTDALPEAVIGYLINTSPGIYSTPFFDIQGGQGPLAGTFKQKDISHVSLYVSMPSVVPLPAAGFLLIGALGGLAALRRRRRAV